MSGKSIEFVAFRYEVRYLEWNCPHRISSGCSGRTGTRLQADDRNRLWRNQTSS
jgi:hypothetical protein